MNIREELRRLPIDELMDVITLNGHIIEKMTARYHGLEHNTDINGSDAWGDIGRKKEDNVEIKSQTYYGNYLLRGRIKFSCFSLAAAKANMVKDEQMIANGFCDKTGECYYEFRFPFSAIYDLCVEKITKALDKQYKNVDILPKDYKDHPEFRIHHVSTPDVLEANQHKFQPKFYKWLYEQSCQFHDQNL